MFNTSERMLLPLTIIFLFFSASLAVTVNYKTLNQLTKRGDGIPDFSFSGYHSSDNPLPSVNRAATVIISPETGDATKRIQNALDSVSKSGGGVVALEAGDFQISAGLTLPEGTSLRGAGPSKTKILVKDGSIAVFTMGVKKLGPKVGAAVAITDSYVPVGSVKVTVKSASGLKADQNVWIQRKVTDKWVRAIGMADLVRDGVKQTWLTPEDTVYQPRKIVSVSSNVVTLDIPLTDQLDSAYMSPQLVVYTPPDSPSEIGLERLAVVLSPSCSGRIINDDSCKGKALSILPWTIDSYARGLAITGFNNAVSIAGNASRITIQSVSIHRDHATDNGAGYAADIAISGYQVLVRDCGTKGDADAKSFPVVTQGLTPGPNAVVRYFAQQDTMQIQPHAHWAHGFLVDNSTATTTLINRKTAGSGHGWAINAGVGWNIIGDYQIQQPPLGTNWCIGCRGGARMTGTNGTLVEEKKEVEPTSLFDAQLTARGKA